MQAERARFLHGSAPRRLFVGAQRVGARNVVAGGQAERGTERVALLLAVGRARLAALGELAGGVHVAEVFATLDIHDDGGAHRWRRLE